MIKEVRTKSNIKGDKKIEHFLWWNEAQKELAKEAKKITDEILTLIQLAAK